MFPFKPNTPYPDMLLEYARARANMRTVKKIPWAVGETGPHNNTKRPDAPQLRGVRPAQAGSKKPAFNACKNRLLHHRLLQSLEQALLLDRLVEESLRADSFGILDSLLTDQG